MKAPEKIKIGKYNITSDGDVIFAWVTNEPDCEAIQHDIEYIRADAFIEKALAYLCNKFYFNNVFYGIVSTDFNAMEEMYEDFRKYMEGE